MSAKLKANHKLLQDYAKNLEQAKRSVVAVGLPVEKVGGIIYGDENLSVAQVGAFHEYWHGFNPVRSFLRVPFAIKAGEVNEFIARQFAQVLESGKSADKALNTVGIFARNISVEAFETDGYGTWAPLQPETVAAKGSSAILIDTGILRNSITWVVRS